MMRKLKFGFDPWGLLLFLAVMLPNFVWFALPAPNDILRGESVTPILDGIASMLQALLAAALCLIVRTEGPRFSWKSPRTGGALVSLALYYAAWAAYYGGIVAPALLIALCVLPCAAFLLFEAERRNWIALLPTAAFSVCHLTSGIINFLL